MAEENTTNPEASPATPPKPEAAAKPAPAAKPAAAKPAAKPKVEKKPLVDNGDGTVTDPNSGLMWKQTDAWLDMHKFFTWPGHKEYVDKVNKDKFAGHTDWRIPTKAEAATLCEKDKENFDKNGTAFPIDPIFALGGATTTWISECTDDKIVRFDFKIGNDMAYPPTEIWSSMRLVRKPAAPAAESPAEAAEAKPAPAAPKPAPKPAPAAS